MLKKFGVTLLVLTAIEWSSAATQAPRSTATGIECSVALPLSQVAELGEGSGVAVSRRVANRLYSHNDSGDPVLFTLDAEGRVIGKLDVEGAKVEDWEAVAVGPCPSGSCIYVGDLGDNDAERRTITIYRAPEPAEATGRVQVRGVFHARYPDGAHDAETMIVTPAGDVLIVTKGETGPVGVYRLPGDATPGTTVNLELVARPPNGGKLSADERITDGAMSPSGELIALRTTGAIAFFRAADLLNGRWQELRRIAIGLSEPQGEGVAFGNDSTLFLVGEGGGNARPGTFARLACTP